MHVPYADSTTSEEYPEPNVEMVDEINAEEHDIIHKTLSQISLPPFGNQLETEQPLGKGILTLTDLDFAHLVDLRRAHETQYAKKGLRTSQTKDSPTNDDKSAQRELLREFHKSLKDIRVGTGLERAARWQAEPTGNALNARVVTNAAATTVRSRFPDETSLILILISQPLRLLGSVQCCYEKRKSRASNISLRRGSL